MRKPRNRITEPLLFILDFLICCIYYPCLVLFLGPFLLYRLWVILIAKLIDPSLVPLTVNDNLVAWDLLTAERQRRPMVYNLGCALHLEGCLSLEEVQQKYSRVLLEPVTPNGDKVYDKLFNVVTLFGGHAFRKPAAPFDINTKIIQVEPKGRKGLSDFTKHWMAEYYRDNSPPWEVVMVPMKGLDQTTILFKWHHTILDGLNLIHFMNTLMDTHSSAPIRPTEPEDSIGAKLRQAMQTPRQATVQLYKLWTSKSAFAFLKSWNDYCPDYLVSKVSLYFADIKLIQLKTASHVTSVNLALFSSVLARLLQDRLASDYVQVAIPLPMPNHPIQKMCNHWVGGTLAVPLKCASLLDRVKRTEENFQAYHDEDIDKIWFRFVFPLASILPLRLYQRVIHLSRRLVGLRALFATAVNFAEGFYEVEGRPVISIQPLFGLYGAISGTCFCYHDRCEFVLNTTAEVAKNQENLDSVLHNYLVEEVEKLVAELTKG